MNGRTEAPRDVIFRMMSGSRNTQALYVVAKLGVADQLAGGPLRCEQLAERLRVKPGPLFRVMRALAAQGVFTQDRSDRFGLTPVSQLLRDDAPDSLRYGAIHSGEEHYRAAGELLHTVRTGETAFDHVYGKPQFEYFAENPEASRIFNLFMAQALRSGRQLAAYSFVGKRLIVDVGGGNGAIIASILQANPRLRGVLFDLPQAVADAPDVLREFGVDDRCEVMTGSFFESVPQGGDVYLLSRVLENWPDEKARAILANCRKAIAEDGTLVLWDAVIPEGDAPSQGKQLDLTMLFMLGGKERTEREWRGLLRDSGFELTRVTASGQTFDLIEAKPV